MDVFNIGPVEHGSVIVVQFNDLPTETEAALLRAAHDAIASRCGHTHFLVVTLHNGAGFDILNEADMAQHGWYRHPPEPVKARRKRRWRA